MRNRRKVLISGLYAPGSGLTNVFQSLVQELKHTYTVQCLGFDTARSTTESTPKLFAGCALHLTKVRGRTFLPDPAWLEQYFATNGVDVVIVSGPFLLNHQLLQVLQRYRATCRILLYLPLEGRLVHHEIFRTLDLVDSCLLYTAYSLENVRALYQEAIEAGCIYTLPQLRLAGHGADISDFYPLTRSRTGIVHAAHRLASRKALFPERPELENAFIVLNANRVYHRKRHDLTIKAFAALARKQANAYLYLHTGVTSEADNIHLKKLIAESGLSDRVLLNSLKADEAIMSVSELNCLYNTCDVGLTTSMGEGWGLTSFEHGATAAPQVMPNHTSFQENWTGHAALSPVVGTEYIFYEAADMFVVDVASIAHELERLCTDAAHYQLLAAAAYQRAADPKLKWAAVGETFKQVVEEVCHLPASLVQA